MSAAPRFLSIEDVLILHAIAIEDQGGDPSIRDRGMLESAVATPAQQFGGQYLHGDIPAMAAAYAFHICKNHPFVDGNKRAATAAMIAFLSDNGWAFDASADDAEPVVLLLAAGTLDKAAFTDWARKNMHEKPKMELRDFFQQFTLTKTQDVAESVLGGGRETEADATIEEAARAIPCIRELKEVQRLRKAENDAVGFDRVGHAIVPLVAIYRMAEDMGYEW